MTEFVFTDDVPEAVARTRRSQYDDFRVAAIVHTGKWAKLVDSVTRESASGRTGPIEHSESGWAGHVWETRVTRSATTPGLFDIYVRHLSSSGAEVPDEAAAGNGAVPQPVVPPVVFPALEVRSPFLPTPPVTTFAAAVREE
jgi:hypothetical protein